MKPPQILTLYCDLQNKKDSLEKRERENCPFLPDTTPFL